MGCCSRCKGELTQDELFAEYAAQADCLGIESLTENQQALVLGIICEDCYIAGEDNKYCITPEMPYCPCCPFFYMDTSNAETREDLDNAPWGCNCTKEQYEKYMKGNKNNGTNIH